MRREGRDGDGMDETSPVETSQVKSSQVESRAWAWVATLFVYEAREGGAGGRHLRREDFDGRAFQMDGQLPRHQGAEMVMRVGD
jgi:hypothetical protein